MKPGAVVLCGVVVAVCVVGGLLVLSGLALKLASDAIDGAWDDTLD